MATYYSWGSTSNERDSPLPLMPHHPSDLLMMNVTPNSTDPHAASSIEEPSDTFDNEQYENGRQLSLSLVMQVPSSYRDDHQFQGGSYYNENKNVEYLSFDSAGKSGAIDNLRQMDFISTRIHEATDIYDSKYLKAAQDLLDEIVNVQSSSATTKQPDRQYIFYSFAENLSEEEASALMMSSSCAPDISSAKQCDLDNKMNKLLWMLNKVDMSYKQYYEQMQILVSSFEMVAGSGAARPYTSLSLETISRQFRCICDAIKKQIQATRGEGQGGGGDDVSNTSQGGKRFYRLRQVDHKLRQQKLLQQFSVMRQPWRPLRGLPENAVSILRAWLFEHFLHPYPKETEKVTLARQTGLTRSQVANWFINARVRLWKPMIEEMYKEEVGNTEANLTSSS
ncbi:unnamed protein product [Cuscuta epithymum]|uniref:Homeobox domain-containing protein n=1 Tax=Cuscuta epithymum TaxID=186058 RepID=A0AAV0EB47_9ASTE|nr:unnamed protein product [Cuscuta epithymum]